MDNTTNINSATEIYSLENRVESLETRVKNLNIWAARAAGQIESLRGAMVEALTALNEIKSGSDEV